MHLTAMHSGMQREMTHFKFNFKKGEKNTQMQNNVLLGNKGIFLFHVAMINTCIKYLILKKSKFIH